jgi:hypothetical protein
MPNVQELNQLKEKIISLIESRGPSLPNHLAKLIGQPPLFTSAFLAELVNDERLTTSNLKVGSSPLYYIKGQEEQLENFSSNLNQREKQAYNLLRENKILEEEKQEPVIRVALKAIPDYAQSVKVRIKEEIKVFWKYFTISEEETRQIIQEIASGSRPQIQETSEHLEVETKEQIPEKQEPSHSVQEPAEEPEQTLPKELEDLITRDTEPLPEEPAQKKPIIETEEIHSKPEQTPIEPKQSPPEPEPEPKNEVIESESEKPNYKTPDENNIQNLSDNPSEKPTELEFPGKIKEYLEAKDIEILKIISEKKKELIAIVRTDEIFGKQSYYLIAKEKKSVTDTDLVLASQPAQQERMPCLILSPGKLNKKAEEYLKDWSNLIKFEKINF